MQEGCFTEGHCACESGCGERTETVFSLGTQEQIQWPLASEGGSTVSSASQSVALARNNLPRKIERKQQIIVESYKRYSCMPES